MKKIIHARNFGVIPDTGLDCTESFRNLLEENPEDTVLIIEKGRYDFYSEKAEKEMLYLSNTNCDQPQNLAIILRNMHNTDFEGNGSEFIFHGQVLPFTVDNSNDIALRNIIIDWDIPLTAEGLIVAKGENFADLEIDQTQFPCKVVNNRLVFTGEDWESPLMDWTNTEFNKYTKRVAFKSGDRFPKTAQEELGPGFIRFHGNFGAYGEPGNRVVVRHNVRRHPGIFANASKNLCFENIILHCTGGLGILAQFCENLNFDGIRFEPNSAKGRYVVSCHDDGIHLSNNKGAVTIENCTFHGLMDDPVNIHGTAARIRSIVDWRTLECEFVHHETKGFPGWAAQGQQISFIDRNTMTQIGTGTVSNYILIEPERFIITFEEDIPPVLGKGDALENITNTASLTCRNNLFGSCRARGILASTPQKILIENNIFESTGSAVLLPGDANYWYESGACADVTIRNNIFTDSCLTSMYQFCEAIISILPEIPRPDSKRPFHRNIKICDNVFQAYDYPVLYAKSTENLEFARNRIVRSRSFARWHPRKHMLSFEYCSKVVIKDNLLIGDVLGRDVHIQGMAAEDVLLQESQEICLKTSET